MEQENVGPSLLQTETIPDTDKHSEETSVSIDSIVNENQDGGTKAIITNIKIGNEAESSVNDNKLDLDINSTDGDQTVSDLKVGEDAVDIANTNGASANDDDDDDDLPAPPDDVLQTHEDEKKLNFDDEPEPEPEIPEPEPEPPFEPDPEPFGVRAGVGNPDEPEPEPEPVGVRAGVGNPDEPEPEPEPEAHFGRAQVGEPDEPEPEPEPEVRAVLPDEPEPEPEPEVRAVLPDEPEPEPEPGVKSAHDYHPRLCHLIKRADFNGYGFNLHGEKDVQGQYIGLVDDNSPAERAGLKKGDRIIEVNGENTESSSHQQVIMQIKSGGDETKLLVVDKVTDDYYKNNGLEIKASLPEVVYKSSETKDTTEMTYTPRSCHIIKWPDFNGYGFNLHAEKERGGQYIGKIDDNSPAQDAGLKERDRIIEVNGVNVEDMTHREVITKIKEGGDETRLLVVDPAADSYYKSRGVTVSSTMQGVKFLQTSRRSPAVSGVTNGESRPARTEPVQNSAPAVQANGGGDFLSMNLSAKEMRERIASKKKADPKQRSNMDFKTKYDMFQKL